MKKVKVFKYVVDEVEFIKEITTLIDSGMPESGYNFVEFKLSDIEYEDTDGCFHYANTICNNAFLTLGFKQNELKPYIFDKGNIRMAYISNVKDNKFIIQRQS